MIAGLPAEHREAARAPLPSSWYPVALLGHVYGVLPSLAPAKDRPTMERVVKDMNRYVADANLGTFYRALLILMTPDRLFETLPRMWSLYFKGIDVAITREPG